MNEKPFRFGIVATPQDGPSWRATARRIEQQGYDTLLMPDGTQLLAPFPALASAAAVTERLRVGTFVLAGPLRPPRLAAWEGHSLAVLTEGRFDFGIGTGRPAAKPMAEQLGLAYGTGAERLAQVAEAVRALRELDGPDRRTPVLLAAGGPKARALAAAEADVVTLAAGPLDDRATVAAAAQDVLAQAGDRAVEIELAMNIFVVGEEVPQWMRHFLEVDVEQLRAHDSLTMLRGSVDEMCDELRRRRAEFGVNRISVNGAFADALAPVVERLAGT